MPGAFGGGNDELMTFDEKPAKKKAPPARLA